MTPFTDDELNMIDPPADPPESSDRQTEAPSARSSDDGDPVAAGVDEDRASKWAIYDNVLGCYLNGVRLRPPTDKMRTELASINADYDQTPAAKIQRLVREDHVRFEWHRV